MMQRYEWKNKEEFGYEGFVSEKRYNLCTKQYNGYIVELGQSRTWHDNGVKDTLISILLCHYDEHNLLDECYGIALAQTIAEAWRIIRELELDSTSSAIQTARNPWCETLTRALEQGQLWIEQNNQVITFEPDFDEYVIEIWSQYRLQNGALTTMSYCANIWEEELPVNIRKAVFGV